MWLLFYFVFSAFYAYKNINTQKINKERGNIMTRTTWGEEDGDVVVNFTLFFLFFYNTFFLNGVFLDSTFCSCVQTHVNLTVLTLTVYVCFFNAKIKASSP